MNQKMRFIGPFLLASIAGAILANPVDASALWVRKHASGCMATSGKALDKDWSIQNDSTTSAMTIVCTFDESDRFNHGDVASVTVNGEDGSSGDEVTARTCHIEQTGTAGGCGALVSTTVSGTGSYSLMPVPDWGSSTSGDYVYTVVELPAKTSSGSRSTLRGVTITD